MIPALTKYLPKISCNASLSAFLFARRDLRPVRLSVRTPGFHPGKKGSTPLRVAIIISLRPAGAF